MVEEKEIIEKLLNGDIKLHQIEKYTENIDESVDIRRKFAEAVSNTKLESSIQILTIHGRGN